MKLAGKLAVFNGKRAVACALRMLVAFSFAFSTVLGAQGAWAASKADGQAQPQASKRTITSITVTNEYGDAVADSSANYSQATAIGQHEEVEDTDAYSFSVWENWSDGAQVASSHVVFSVSDSSLARISTSGGTGVLTAVNDVEGTVYVSARLDSSYATDNAEGGKSLEAWFGIDVATLSSTVYVTSLDICDSAGASLGGAYTFPSGTTASDASVALTASVGVRYTGGSRRTETYLVTAANGLSAQTGGLIPDLSWSVVLSDLGSVSSGGEYKASAAGTNTVRVATNFGEGGTAITREIVITLNSVEKRVEEDPGDDDPDSDDPDDTEGPDEDDADDDPDDDGSAKPRASAITASGDGTGGGGSGAGQATNGEGGSASLRPIGSGGAGGKNGGAWSVLKAASSGDLSIEDNPLEPFTAPLGAGILAAGGTEAFVRFRRQKRTPDQDFVEGAGLVAPAAHGQSNALDQGGSSEARDA